MKVNREIIINGQNYISIEEDVRLDLHIPGRALFEIESSEPITSGVVRFLMGRSKGKVFDWFTGYIESYKQVTRRTAKIFVREFSQALCFDINLSLRHVSASDVLREISNQTGLMFAHPNKDYMHTLAGAFYSHASGAHAIDSLGPAFGINDFIWQQQGDGKIFVGSWHDSRWSDQQRHVQIPLDIMERFGAHESATVPAIPGLRPGVKFNNNRFVTSVQFFKNQMVFTWSNRLERS